MAEFAAGIEAQIDGPTVRRASLIVFDFVSGPKRVWEGTEDVVVNGETYRGAGDIGRMNAINSGPGQAVEEIVFSLAGPPEMLAFFTADSEESIGRDVFVYLQFFNDDWSQLSDPIQVFWGRMGALIVDRPIHRVGEPAARIISVRATNPFHNRRRPSHAMYSDGDQKARTDGTDNFLIRASQMADAKVTWPVI